jgi:hypothetical protein
MATQSDNPPDILTLDQWNGLNQQSRRASIDDQEEWWNENFFAIGPGNLRTCWGHGPAIYTCPPGTQIVRMFFGYIGTGTGPEGFPPPAPEFLGPPPGQLGWMFLDDGSIDEVDLSSGYVSPLRNVGLSRPETSLWSSVAPNYWASAKVWRPQWVGNSIGEVGGVVFGSPQGLYAWDGSTLSWPGDLAPRWLTNEAMGEQETPMPIGLPGIYCMEVYKERLWVAGKDVVSFSSPSNGADFSTIHGGGSFGYYGDKLVYSFMDLAESAGYLYCYGDSSTDMINNVQMTGSGTPTDPALTNFSYTNVDPQVGQRFPRPVGRWGRYHTLFNGAGIFQMTGGDAQVVGDKVTNIWNTLDSSQFYPTMAPATMFGFRVMLVNGLFTDPFGVKRSLLLMWHGKLQGKNFWSVASQNLNLTQIGAYEQDSTITPYGTDGTSLYKLFAQPDPGLVKRLSTKLYRGQDIHGLTLKNYKRVFAELKDESGQGVSITGRVTTRGGGVPTGVQAIGFEVAPGVPDGYAIEPAPISGAGLAAELDLESKSPDFTIERLHVAAEERTLWGA